MGRDKGVITNTLFSTTGRALLRGGAGTFALAAALAATPALAQAQTQAPQADGQAAAAQDTGADEVVVTGTLFKGNDTISPVTTLTTQDLDTRGINTVQDALQQLSSNNGPSLTNSFTANGAFAGGASSISLRGLSTNSTLVLFDGLRAAYYPLADDGSRNFVDLNTIPDDIVERIEVLRDGASSSYGADAIAGVVNIITKKTFKGISARAEAGIAERGIAANQRLTLTAGIGDLNEKGFNAYVSGFYYRSDKVNNRDLPAPYNTADESSFGGPNGIFNGRNPDGSYTGFVLPYDFYVRPYSNVGYAGGVQNGGVAQGRYQKLTAAPCIGGSSTTLNAAELAANPAAPTGIICQNDFVRDYQVVSPQIERFGGSAKFTANIGSSSQAYLELNFQQTRSGYTGFPPTLRGNAPTGILFPQFSTSTAQSANLAPGSGVLALPVFVCAARVNCDTAADRRLNPNNPFAAQGLVARLTGRFQEPTYSETRNRVYRAAFGVNGTIFDDVNYRFDATAMHTDLRRLARGYVYIQNLLDVIGDGSYNFLNPAANSARINDYVRPDNITNASSDLYQAQLSFSRGFFHLPGGPIQVGVGGTVYYEAVNSPSQNPDNRGPTQRYFTLNAFGTVGSRTVFGGFYEVNAPVFDKLELNASGRYDTYSSGQSSFSPKFGFKAKPIRQVTIRGTYSEGFRIPAFAEANALPTTGYVTQVVTNIPANVRAQYGAACAVNATAGASCPQYLTQYSIGLTTLASPNLAPERSRSFTLGIVVEPIRNITLTVDYFNIEKTGVITAPSSAPAIAAYYAGQPIPAGYAVIADAPDVANPNALPRIAFVQSQLINANRQKAEGIDFGATGRFNVGPFKWTSNLQASLLLELSTTFPDGTTEQYVDTLGNFNLTAGSGTFRWRGYWTNTLETGPVALSGTVNYVSGYDLSAQDQGTGYRDGGLFPGYPGNGPRVSNYITIDMNATAKITDRFSFYVNVLNLTDALPPIDPVTYGAYLYNPVQAGNGIFGRQFRAGVKVNL
ncbi:MAG: TonB-dependent receptor [Sphingomonas sp.]|uniref:TonB-dependent receptor domain-containing protein n=1 Tax=Sphingomonas sp. TaxID=28214 RepID=UPI0025E2D3AE|nr:TonB-dependent receptor [Sphingomonas sp.]MBX9880728.1 TonB-dependent receptor [Sphingomonas sp.]